MGFSGANWHRKAGHGQHGQAVTEASTKRRKIQMISRREKRSTYLVVHSGHSRRATVSSADSKYPGPSVVIA